MAPVVHLLVIWVIIKVSVSCFAQQSQYKRGVQNNSNCHIVASDFFINTTTKKLIVYKDYHWHSEVDRRHVHI